MINTIIIGAGQCGLSVSYYLTKKGIDHLILEKGKIGEDWRSRRWDNFHLLTPNFATKLPGFSYKGNNPKGFDGAKKVVKFLEEYAESFKAPILENVEVKTVTKNKNFLVETSNKEIKFTFNNRGKELFADFDAEKLLIAIQNLMENAVNYTPPKGKISVALFAETKNAIIEIKDTGIGIPGGELHKLFKKFFRASNAMLLQTEGSGLGLFIAKNIIEKHKGKIVIESEEGRGVTAKIFIPIA